MLCLVRTKSCRRCGGDLSLEYDAYGVYAECIQCGATWSKKYLTHPVDNKEKKSPDSAPPKTSSTADNHG